MRRRALPLGLVAVAALVAGAVYLPGAGSKPARHRHAFGRSRVCDVPPENIGNITVWNGFSFCVSTRGLRP